MRLLDLFCGAGGAAMGYSRAGFAEIVGVDNRPQKNYPFTFVLGDALEYVAAHGREFDAIHASPPCQAYSDCTPPQHKASHQKLIPDVRMVLSIVGCASVIENVSGARGELECPLMLCGTMFGLPLWRHRYFEIEPPLIPISPLSCNHSRLPILVSGTTRRKKEGRIEFSIADCKKAMDIDWMVRTEIDQAIPPAYTEFIGRQLIQYLSRT